MAKTCALVALLLLVSAVPSYAALIEYKNTGGTSDLSVANDWWVITSVADPNSTTGVKGVPASFSDSAYIRNGQTGLTLASATINAKFVGIGANSPSVTGTSVTVSTGGTIETRALPGTATTDNMWIAYNKSATLNVNGGTVKAMDVPGTGGSYITLGGKSTAETGTLNVTSGLVQFGSLYAGYQNGIGIINHSGGTMKTITQTGPRIYLGYNNGYSGYNGRCEYNLSGTGFLDMSTGLVQIKLGTNGNGLFNMTGGSIRNMWSGGDLVMGTTAVSVSEFRLLGGKMDLNPTGNGRIDQLWGKTKFVVNQAGAMDIGGSWQINNTSDPTSSHSVELRVNSANDFQLKAGDFAWFSATKVAAVLTDGYTPTVGQTWKFVDVGIYGITLPSDGFHLDRSRYDWSGIDGKGWALYKDTVNNDVRLEYVPEPATLSVLVLGGLALLRRRR